jgi:DNA-binding SARP family transcriptional activator/tetratricopeptide (TPR) repeat protein
VEASVTIRLFGRPRVDQGAAAFVLRAPPKVVELLAYLIVHAAAPVSREKVRTVLWPDLDDESAGGNLRRHLHLLARALPPVSDGRPYLLNTSTTTQWNAKSAWVDGLVFERASAQATSHREAIDSYTGDFLESFYEDWVLIERERFRARQLELLRGVIRRERGERDFPRALADIAHSLTIDPWQEDAVRAEMLVRGELGDRSGALVAFRTFSERLRAELDTEPMPETRAVYERLLHDGNVAKEEWHSTHPQVRERMAQGRSLPFHGREHPFEQLTAAWDEAARGRGRMALVGGEAGVGKSRLVAELALHAEGQGGRVFVGTTSSGEPQPYETIVDVLRAALPLLLKIAPDPQVLGALSALLPELTARPEIVEPKQLSPDGNRTRLFEAIVSALTALARGRPLLIILEDVHWAGSTTIALIEFIVRRLIGSSVLVVATYRDEDVGRAHPLRAARRRLELEGAMTHIALERLTPEAVARIARDVVEEGVDVEATTGALYARSEGLPLFLEEVIRDPEQAPSMARLAIPSRLERLEDAARTLAEIAAVAGVGFDVEVVREASGWSEAAVLRALDALVAARFVRVPQRLTRNDFVFVHHLVHAEIYGNVDPERRRQRHAVLAQILSEFATGDDERAAEIAAHYEGAGERERAAQGYAAAARRAERLFAGEETLAYAARALALSCAPSLVVEMRVLRAKVAHRLIRDDVEREELDALEDLPKTTLESADLEIVRAGRLMELGEFEAARKAAEKAIRLAREERDVARQAQALLQAAVIAVWAGWYDAAEVAFSAVAELRLPPDHPSSVGLLRLRSLHEAKLFRSVEATRLAVEFLEAARRVGDLDAEAEAEGRLGSVFYGAGDYEKAEPHLKRSAELSARIGNARAECAMRIHLGNVAVMRGRFALADNLFAAAAQLCRELAHAPYLLPSTQWLARLALWRGDPQSTLRILDETREMPHDPVTTSLGHYLRALAFAEVGDDKAPAFFDEALRVSPTPALFQHILAFATLAAYDAGDDDRARALKSALSKEPTQEWQTVDDFPHVVFWAHAAVAHITGDHAIAQAHFRRATACFAKVSATLADDEARAAYAAIPWNARFLAWTD